MGRLPGAAGARAPRDAQQRWPALGVRSLSAVAAAPLLGGAQVSAQSVSTAVVPETITIGDVFHAAVRVELPRGAEPIFPDTLALASEDMEAAGRVRVSVDSAGGARYATAIYPLTAWRTGTALQLPDVSFAIRSGGAQEIVTAAFPSFVLSSVLPADTAGIAPKPAKDVWGANRVWWPWLLAAAALLLALAVAYYLWRRRRPRAVVVEPGPLISPREAALTRLAHVREAGLVERGELKTFYSEITGALRTYLEAVDRDLGADLTTSELAGHTRRRGAPGPLLELLQFLGNADLVKFARARPAAADAYRDLDAARAWIEHYAGPAAEPAALEERAA
ncbi:MAG: hypothetical protein ACREKM_05215 [Longimicrobiales bacterium]